MTALDYLLVWLTVSLMCGLTIAACARYARRAEAARDMAVNWSARAAVSGEFARLMQQDTAAKAKQIDALVRTFETILRECGEYTTQPPK